MQNGKVVQLSGKLLTYHNRHSQFPEMTELNFFFPHRLCICVTTYCISRAQHNAWCTVSVRLVFNGLFEIIFLSPLFFTSDDFQISVAIPIVNSDFQKVVGKKLMVSMPLSPFPEHPMKGIGLLSLPGSSPRNFCVIFLILQKEGASLCPLFSFSFFFVPCFQSVIR